MNYLNETKKSFQLQTRFVTLRHYVYAEMEEGRPYYIWGGKKSREFTIYVDAITGEVTARPNSKNDPIDPDDEDSDDDE